MGLKRIWQISPARFMLPRLGQVRRDFETAGMKEAANLRWPDDHRAPDLFDLPMAAHRAALVYRGHRIDYRCNIRAPTTSAAPETLAFERACRRCPIKNRVVLLPL